MPTSRWFLAGPGYVLRPQGSEAAGTERAVETSFTGQTGAGQRLPKKGLQICSWLAHGYGWEAKGPRKANELRQHNADFPEMKG